MAGHSGMMVNRIFDDKDDDEDDVDETHKELTKLSWRVVVVQLHCLQCTYSPRLLTCLA